MFSGTNTSKLIHNNVVKSAILMLEWVIFVVLINQVNKFVNPRYVARDKLLVRDNTTYNIW